MSKPHLHLLCLATTVMIVVPLACDSLQPSGDWREACVPADPDVSSDDGPALEDRVDDLGSSTQTGQTGDLLLAWGIVYNPDGSPCSTATVTLDWLRDGQTRYLAANSDENGAYAIYGPSAPSGTCPVWAATTDGYLGAAWVPSTWRPTKPKGIELQLRGGQTTLHVRNTQCKPIAGAWVDVVASGIDDLSLDVPPNIRRILRRRSDDAGIVRWPSRLGDYDLDFEVTAIGYDVQRRDQYSGNFPERIKVLVVGGDERDQAQCTELVKAELESRN